MIVPQSLDENGFKDIAMDDYDDRPDIKDLQRITLAFTHRARLPADQQ